MTCRLDYLMLCNDNFQPPYYITWSKDSFGLKQMMSLSFVTLIKVTASVLNHGMFNFNTPK